MFLVTAEREWEWELRTRTSSTGTTLSEGAQMPHDCFSHGLQRHRGEGRNPVTTEALNVQTLVRLPQTPLQREGRHTTAEAQGSPGSATAAPTPRAAFPLSLLRLPGGWGPDYLITEGEGAAEAVCWVSAGEVGLQLWSFSVPFGYSQQLLSKSV